MWLIFSTFHLLFSLSTVDVNECINHFLKIFWSIHSYYLIFNSVFESSIVLWCKSFVVLLCECHNLLKFNWIFNHWFILLQNMNTLFCCLLLINYFKNSSKLFLKVFIVIKYQFFVFISFLDCLVKKLMQLKINSIEDCILEQEYSVKFLVHLESELLVIEFNIQLKLNQEDLQLFLLISEDIRH